MNPNQVCGVEGCGCATKAPIVRDEAWARELFREQLGPRDDLARYGEKAAVAAILVAVSENHGDVVERAARAMATIAKVGPWEKMPDKPLLGWGETTGRSYWRTMANVALAAEAAEVKP